MEKEKYDLNEFSKIKIPDSIKNIPRCDWCNKPLPKRHIEHINRCQEPAVHQFCSKTCKEKWCEAALKGKKK
ncbi:MAG: hypothetical protein ACTSVU_07730 [Promethearchaeota archaeon]